MLRMNIFSISGNVFKELLSFPLRSIKIGLFCERLSRVNEFLVSVNVKFPAKLRQILPFLSSFFFLSEKECR